MPRSAPCSCGAVSSGIAALAGAPVALVVGGAMLVLLNGLFTQGIVIEQAKTAIDKKARANNGSWIFFMSLLQGER